MKHTIGLRDDQLVRQNRIGCGDRIRIAQAAVDGNLAAERSETEQEFGILERKCIRWHHLV